MTDEDFENFWKLYPKGKPKKPAYQKFLKLKKILLPAILSALARDAIGWRGKELQYIPHPATWLNQERWNNESPLNPTPVCHPQSSLSPSERLSALFRQQEREELANKQDSTGTSTTKIGD